MYSNKKVKSKKQINPYIKDAEISPCTWCMMWKPAHNNISYQMSDSLRRKEENKNKISQKAIFGTADKKTFSKKVNQKQNDKKKKKSK